MTCPYHRAAIKASFTVYGLRSIGMGLKEYFDGKIVVVDLGEFEKKISEDEVDGLVEILLPNIELKAV